MSGSEDTVLSLAAKRERRTIGVLPHNMEAEQGLLGALLVDHRAFGRIGDALKPEHFHVPVHQRLFAMIQTMVGQGRAVTPTLAKQIADADPDLDHVGGGAYLEDLAASVVTVLNVSDYAHTIIENHIRRELFRVGDELRYEAATIDAEITAAAVLEATEAKLFAIAGSGEQESTTHSWTKVLTDVIASADAARKREGKLIGVTTGLFDLDRKMAGLVKSDMTILAARPGMGKTALAGGIMWKAAQSGAPVLFFSLEMAARQLGQRIAAAQAGVSVERLRKGELNDSEFRAFIGRTLELNGLPIVIDDRAGASIAYMNTKARRMKRQQGLGLIIVDYLQLISGLRQHGDNRTNEVTEVTKGLKGLAKTLDVPVLALSQLSRAVEQREDKRPQMSDLRESGSIEQDADEIIFLYREHYYMEKEPTQRDKENDTDFNDRVAQWIGHKKSVEHIAEAILAKNRHGPTGTVKLHFDGPTTTFSNLSAFDDPRLQ